MRTQFRALVLCAAAAGMPALADVSLTTGDAVRATAKPQIKAKDLRNAARRGAAPTARRALATGSIALIDASGLKYFINTNITFSTSSSASGAMSEASYTHAVAASTLNGGFANSTLNDAFDGYNTMCVNPARDQAGTCETGNASFIIYNKNGPATLDSSCGNRQVDFPVHTIVGGSAAGLQMSRKVYVPSTDTFARWLNIFTNPTASPISVRVIIANNLGSDANTRITGSSSGDTTATTADTWVGTFQNFSGTTSSDPRLAHILQGPSAVVPLQGIHFADGDDNPYWSYDLTIPANQTRVLVNFVTAQPTKAAAATKAASLTAGGLPPVATACMTASEQSGTGNFGIGSTVVPALSTNGLVVLGVALALSAAAVLRKSIL
jgi:hypothetical protein